MQIRVQQVISEIPGTPAARKRQPLAPGNINQMRAAAAAPIGTLAAGDVTRPPHDVSSPTAEVDA